MEPQEIKKMEWKTGPTYPVHETEPTSPDGKGECVGTIGSVQKTENQQVPEEGRSCHEDRRVLLQECESVLERGRKSKSSFMEQGGALLKIRSERLYTDKGYITFDTYCHEEWGFTRQRACDLIKAFETVEKLPPGIPTPKNERQARALRRQERKGGSEQNPNETPIENPPPPRTEKEELFSRIETQGMQLNILLRKLTEDGDQRTALGRIAPVCEWIKMVEEEAI